MASLEGPRVPFMHWPFDFQTSGILGVQGLLTSFNEGSFWARIGIGEPGGPKLRESDRRLQ